MRKIAPLLHIIKPKRMDRIEQLKRLGHEIDFRSSHKEGTRHVLKFSVALPMFNKKIRNSMW
jgi:hypothetical protein